MLTREDFLDAAADALAEGLPVPLDLHTELLSRGLYSEAPTDDDEEQLSFIPTFEASPLEELESYLHG